LTKGGIGIFVCGSGVGISMAANRYKGIRAALCHCVEYAKMARLHNNANVLCLGGRFLTLEEAKAMIETFLNTEFLGGKYQVRMAMMDE
jgi:ribose 5-phosphate isomerase B